MSVGWLVQIVLELRLQQKNESSRNPRKYRCGPPEGKLEKVLQEQGKARRFRTVHPCLFCFPLHHASSCVDYAIEDRLADTPVAPGMKTEPHFAFVILFFSRQYSPHHLLLHPLHFLRF